MFSAAILFVKDLGSILDNVFLLQGTIWIWEQEEAAYLVYWGM